MLKQQYSDFLVDKISEWFSSNIKIGNRYKYYADDKEQIESIYNSFLNLKVNTLYFQQKDYKQELKYIIYSDKKLIIVTDVEMQDSYISSIRDAISSKDEQLVNCALLVLHTSKLDTLINSAIDLSQEDLPLNYKLIKKDLENLITKKSKYNILFTYLLEYQTKIIIDEGQSVFGFEVLYKSVINDKIDFESFELFEDEDLYNLENDKDTIEKRINQNDEIYRKIKDTITNFPNELEDKLPDYSSEFIKDKITIDDWSEVTYNELINEKENNKGQQISFLKIKEDILIKSPFIKSKSSSSTGEREKNIILFANNQNMTFNFKFEGKGIETKQFSIDSRTLDYNLKYDGQRKELRLDILDYDFSPKFFNLKLNRQKSSEKFTFRILLIKENDFNLDCIKYKYLIRPRTKDILLQLDEFNLDFNPTKNTSITLEEDNQEIDIQTFGKVDIEEYYKNNDEVKFSIKNGTNSLKFFVEGSKEEESFSIPFLFNKDKLDRLFDDNTNVEFNKSKNKAIYDGRETPLIAERLIYIKYEQEFIDNNRFTIDLSNDFYISDLENIDVDIYSTFKELISYFRDNRTTPSLCAWNDELIELSESFVNTYLEYMKDVKENTSLDDDVKILFEFGFVYKEGRKMISPFSPLILSYIVNLVKEAKEDDSYKDLSKVTLNRLNAKGLFPYLYIDSQNYSFTNVIKDNALWLEFIPNEENEFSYIKKLSFEKIDEFTSSFKDLFEFAKDAPLIVNSINNSENHELFEGIVKFYSKSIKESKTPIKIVVNLYDEKYLFTSFDLFADLDKYEDIKNKFAFIKKDDDTLIDIIRTHVSYSKHTIDEEQKYCHLSFFKNNEKVQINDTRTLEQTKSGLVANGLISGESSQKEKEFYFSGFGLKNIEDTSKSHIQLAKIYNSMQKAVYQKGISYESKKTIALMISENFKELLTKSYKNSLWTVIIDPKVTLDFFDNEENLILIHYSDQYSSSANYDAVTVTAQKELYSNVLFEELGNIDKENIVKQFNAFNGEWLIKMITENENIKKEKESIISAYKYMTTLIDMDDITWVPMSVAEMIRVSGNVGLSMADSDFSRYNELKNNEDSKLSKGAISDDILLVGFKNDDVILYPVEVKSSVSISVINKAIEQTKSLRNFFYGHLFEGNSLKTRLLKGLFIRQVFMQIEKYELYDIFDETYFNPLHESREKLLDGEFELVDLDNYSKCSVIAFLKEQHFTQMQIKDDIVLEIKLPYEYQKKMIHLSYNELKSKVHNGEYGTNSKYLLSNTKEKLDLIEETQPTHEMKNKEITSETQEKVIERNLIEKSDSIKLPETPMYIKFGTNTITENEVLWYLTDSNKVTNTNTGIIGVPGTGKTQFTKSVITQMVKNYVNNVNSTPIDILIFNYKAEDYLDEKFVKATNAKIYEPYHLPFNPLALFGKKPLLPVHTANLFKTTLSKAFRLGPVQQSNLNRIIYETYESRGIEKANMSTWDNLSPTINDLWEVYNSEEKPQIDSLYAALEKLSSFEIFEPDSSKTKSLFDMMDGVTVINIAQYDPDIQNLIVAITLDIFYTQMQVKGASKQKDGFRELTRMILVDEADNFMSQDFESLRKILKEGREFGVGTILSTQQLTHFKTAENDYTDNILSWIIHKVDKLKSKDVEAIFNTSTKQESDQLMNQIRQIENFHSLYVDGKKEIQVMHDYAFFQLMKELDDNN